MKKLDQFGLLIAKHDLYYFYADDYNVWRAGHEQSNKIENLYRSMNPKNKEAARNMWNTMVDERYQSAEGLKWKAT